jgi:hypothetical protein
MERLQSQAPNDLSQEHQNIATGITTQTTTKFETNYIYNREKRRKGYM